MKCSFFISILLLTNVPICCANGYSVLTGLLCQSLKPEQQVTYLPYVPQKKLIKVHAGYSKVLQTYPDKFQVPATYDTFIDFAFAGCSNDPNLPRLDAIIKDFGTHKKTIVSDYDESSCSFQTKVYRIDLKDWYLQKGKFIHIPTLKSECEKFAGKDVLFDFRIGFNGFPVTVDELDDGRLLFALDKGDGRCFCVIYDSLTQEVVESRQGRVNSVQLLSIDFAELAL